MPLEIRELIIKARVNESRGSGARPASSKADNAMIIKKAAEQVMQMLKDQKER